MYKMRPAHTSNCMNEQFLAYKTKIENLEKKILTTLQITFMYACDIDEVV